MNTDDNYDLGDSYVWTVVPPQNGEGQLTFKGETFGASRVQANNTQPAVWKRGDKK